MAQSTPPLITAERFTGPPIRHRVRLRASDTAPWATVVELDGRPVEWARIEVHRAPTGGGHYLTSSPP